MFLLGLFIFFSDFYMYFIVIMLSDDIWMLRICRRFYSFFGEKVLYKFSKERNKYK